MRYWERVSKGWHELFLSSVDGLQFGLEVFLLAGKGLRLVLYNTRYCTGAGWGHHVPFPFAGTLRTTCECTEAVNEYISSLCPDLVGLVESDGGSWRCGGRSQPDDLAERLGFQCVFSRKYRHSRLAGRIPLIRHQGNAVIAGLPMSGTTVHRLKKGIKNAVIETGFERFTFLLVHLSIGEKARREQIQEIARIVRGISEPVLLAGDFNVFNGQAELDPLINAGLAKAGPALCKTFPSGNPRLGLDLVLHSKEISIVGFDVPDARFSDHLPVVCDFTLDMSPGICGGAQWA